MSDRGRSRLFGRPSELLVDEGPRIQIPTPPRRSEPVSLPPVNPLTDPPVDELDDDAPQAGPARVYVGPPRPPPGPTLSVASPAPAPSPAPSLRVASPGPGPAASPSPASPPAPAISLRVGGARGAPPRANEPPAGLMDDAVGELGDVLGRRIPSREARGTWGTSDPFRTSLPPSEPPAGTLSRGSRPAASQGIPTAAARLRAAARRPAGDDPGARAELRPSEILEVVRGPSLEEDPSPPASEAPKWDDPRFRRADPVAQPPPPLSASAPARRPDPTTTAPTPNAASLLAARAAPAVATGFERTDLTELTSPGRPSHGLELLDPLSEPPSVTASRPAPTPATPAADPPTAPPPAARLADVGREPPRPLPLRRRRPLLLVGAALAACVLALGGVEARHPGTLAAAARAVTHRTAKPAIPSGPEGAPSEVPVADATPVDATPVAEPSAAPSPSAAESPAAEPPAPAEPSAPAPTAQAPPTPAPAPPPLSEPAPAPTDRTAEAARGQSAGSAPAEGAVPAEPALPTPIQRYSTPTGRLIVECDRKATLYVDGARKGTTGDAPLELTDGKHQLRMVAGGRSNTMNVRVDAGELRMVQCGIR